jgi:exopolysaccharide production protein ExoZ
MVVNRYARELLPRCGIPGEWIGVPQAGQRKGFDGKLEGLQALRGVAVLLVLLFHLTSIERKYGGRILLPDLANAGASGVDLFFLISGFVMATLMRREARGFPSAARFLGRRAARIYPIYWFYTAVVLAVFLVRPGWVNASQGGEFDLLASVLLLPTDGLPLLMVGWTLIHEMYFYLAMALFLWVLPEKAFVAALIAWGLAAAAGWVWLGPDMGPWLRLATNPLTLEFIAGALLGAGFGRARPGFRGTGWGMAASGALLLAGYAAFVSRTGRLMLEPAERAILFGAPMALLLFFLMIRERRKPVRPPRWLVAIGDASYSIYLSHLLVLGALGRIWSAFRTQSPFAHAAALALLAAGTVAAGLAGYAFLEKPWLDRARALPCLRSPDQSR